MTRKEAIEELKARKEHYEMGDGCEFLVEALDKGIEALENQKIGHWIETDLDIYECSECHIGTSVGFKENFCSNCGAKMIEPQESEDNNETD